jgi:hypothetical protein
VQPAPTLQLGLPAHWLLPVHDPAPVQFTSQRHADPQVTSPGQLTGPLHSTSHAPLPHEVAPPHEAMPVHATWQPVAAEQSTPSAQLSSPTQSTMHGTPAGHSTTLAHEPVASQRMMHVPPLHSSQSDGQVKESTVASSPPPGSTHQLLSQTRPSWQSPGTLQRNVSERVSTRQASAIARPSATAIDTRALTTPRRSRRRRRWRWA